MAATRAGDDLSPDPDVLLIFDCDGVLVDSEPLALRILIETIAEGGLTIDVEDAHELFLGRSLSAISTILGDEFGLDLDGEALERMRTRLYEAFRRELRPVDGIDEALDHISLARCVASSSQMERIRLSLAVTNLLHRFEPNVFSATMVSNGKPAPDLFLLAARSMAREPSRCIVIEDSPAGVEAAKRAGMMVYAFTGGGHASGPDHRAAIAALKPQIIFSDMRQLPAILASSGDLRIIQ